MYKFFSQILIGIAMSALKTLAKVAWDGLWDLIFSSIADAEKQWTTTGTGQVKKTWVLGKIMAYLKTERKFNGFQLWAIEFFIGTVIDKIIEQLNASFGGDWVNVCKNIKAVLESKIPFLK